MSCQLATLLTRCVLTFSVCLVAVGGAAAAARAADAEAVTIDTTFIVKTPPVRLDNPTHEARASVILMTGGDGLLGLDATGNVIDFDRQFPDPVRRPFLAS